MLRIALIVPIMVIALVEMGQIMAIVPVEMAQIMAIVPMVATLKVEITMETTMEITMLQAATKEVITQLLAEMETIVVTKEVTMIKKEETIIRTKEAMEPKMEETMAATKVMGAIKNPDHQEQIYHH